MNENARWDAPGGFSALPAGTVLDRYRIDSVIAAGGFGITYLCHHVTLGKPYALKEHFPRQFAYRDSTTMDVLPTDPGTFKWALERFVQEGQALARCSHPNVVAVVDVFEANQTAYMVLGYEEGRSLKTWLDMLGRAPTQAEIDAILRPLLDALSYVHAQGLLHRDIAPDNIMIRSDGKPCLIDFGSARQAMAERSQAMSALIKSGYSPPEQYTQSSRTQGPWSDIYALGATLYRAVTGQTPPESTERAFDDALVPLRTAIADPRAYREGLLDGIERSLAFHYAKRPQSIAEWQSILFAEAPRVSEPTREANSARPTPAFSSPTSKTPQGTPERPTSRSRGGKAVAAVAALVLLLGGGMAIGWSVKQAAIERAATLKIEEDRGAREKAAAAAAAQRQADQDARTAHEKAERDRDEAERAAALRLKAEEDARIAREREAQRRAAEERAERERAERKRAEDAAAAAAAQRRADEAARIAREKVEAERAAAVKRKLDEDARIAREQEAQRRAAEEQAQWDKTERERAEQATRQKAEDDARAARETAEREKAEAERADAVRLKAEEDARLAREKEAQRRAAEERAKRDLAERERAQKASAAAAAAAAARNKAAGETKKDQKAETAKREAGTNCPASALKASGVLWSKGEIRSGGTVTGRHPCGRSMECAGGFGGSGGFGRTCRWL